MAFLRAAILIAALNPAQVMAVPPSDELPQGQSVVHGDATFNVSETTLNINQSSDKLITNWDSFNIGSQAQVNFVQSDSSSLSHQHWIFPMLIS